MVSTLKNELADECRDDASQPLKVLILYEDLRTAKCAMDTYARAVLQAGPDFEFVSRMWKFTLLEIPKLRKIAAEETAEADIIMISAYGLLDLPTAVETWLEMWLQNRGNRAGALVLLLDGTDETHKFASPVHLRLLIAAQRANLDFFSKANGQGQPNFNVAMQKLRVQTTSGLAAASNALIQEENMRFQRISN